ncbi:hypothetical protein P7C70_g5963, partial [Phenoliferia sp. Uapishka_3]
MPVASTAVSESESMATFAEKHFGEIFPRNVDFFTTLIDLMQGLLTSPHHNNVCLSFPRDGGRELWANAEFLADTCPYFKTLLQSGFSENQGSRPPKLTVKRTPLEFNDSDDDEALAKPVATSSPGCTCASSHHMIEITQSSYVTYRAILCWIYTSFIEWAPLSSSFSDDGQRSKARLATLVQKRPKLPTPASPKSVYRLSHFLELKELQKLALQAFKSQLSVDNVMEELFSETSGTYSEVMELLIEFVIANREGIRKKMNWDEISDRLGELPWGGKIAFKLMKSGL